MVNSGRQGRFWKGRIIYLLKKGVYSGGGGGGVAVAGRGGGVIRGGGDRFWEGRI